MKRINLILYIGILVFLAISCKDKTIIPTKEISLRSNDDITVEVFAKNILHPIHVYDSLGKNVKVYNEIEIDSIIRIFVEIPQNGSFKLSNLKDVFMLDFSNNASLLEIDASNISAIDGYLDCSNCNQLTDITIAGNNVITSIDCNNSVSLNSLNVELCRNLRMIKCDSTNISTLKLDIAKHNTSTNRLSVFKHRKKSRSQTTSPQPTNYKYYNQTAFISFLYIAYIFKK